MRIIRMNCIFRICSNIRRIFRSYMAIPNAKCVDLVLAEVVNYHHDTNGVKLIHMRNETAY